MLDPGASGGLDLSAGAVRLCRSGLHPSGDGRFEVCALCCTLYWMCSLLYPLFSSCAADPTCTHSTRFDSHACCVPFFVLVLGSFHRNGVRGGGGGSGAEIRGGEASGSARTLGFYSRLSLNWRSSFSFFSFVLILLWLPVVVRATLRVCLVRPSLLRPVLTGGMSAPQCRFAALACLAGSICTAVVHR